jgi:hypothetical protein
MNIDSITEKALPMLKGQANSQNMDNDWITNFFDKARLVSDDQMQALWSRILAGEANTPGTYSKRTVNLLSSLDKRDAELFQLLCSFAWNVSANTVPVVLDLGGEIYTESGLNYEALMHLNEIGLISFEATGGYSITYEGPQVPASYFSDVVLLASPSGKLTLQAGKVMLSKAGKDLAGICQSSPRDGFRDYVLDFWKAIGITIEAVPPTRLNDKSSIPASSQSETDPKRASRG